MWFLCYLFKQSIEVFLSIRFSYHLFTNLSRTISLVKHITKLLIMQIFLSSLDLFLFFSFFNELKTKQNKKLSKLIQQEHCRFEFFSLKLNNSFPVYPVLFSASSFIVSLKPKHHHLSSSSSSRFLHTISSSHYSFALVA